MKGLKQRAKALRRRLDDAWAGDIQTPDAPPTGDDSLLTVPGGSPVVATDPGE